MKLLKQLKGPVAAAHVVHLAGGGDGKFGLTLASEEIVEEIGNEEKGVGDVQSRRERFAHGEKLEERVELHELDAGGVKNLFLGNLGEGALKNAVGARVAVHV